MRLGAASQCHGRRRSHIDRSAHHCVLIRKYASLLLIIAESLWIHGRILDVRQDTQSERRRDEAMKQEKLGISWDLHAYEFPQMLQEIYRTRATR